MSIINNDVRDYINKKDEIIMLDIFRIPNLDLDLD
jgi:hypothetical protein